MDKSFATAVIQGLLQSMSGINWTWLDCLGEVIKIWFAACKHTTALSGAQQPCQANNSPVMDTIVWNWLNRAVLHNSDVKHTTARFSAEVPCATRLLLPEIWFGILVEHLTFLEGCHHQSLLPGNTKMS